MAKDWDLRTGRDGKGRREQKTRVTSREFDYLFSKFLDN